MNISRRWLEEYITLDMGDEELGNLLTSLGLEVEGIELKEPVKGGLAGVVIGEVKTCEDHPDADRLRVTTVDVGDGEMRQIVCGAPNVAVGQRVLVAVVGTTLYDGKGEAWKIKNSKIRGVESQGMICAEDELGLGESHDGIMVLPEDTPIGMPAADYFDIESDTVYEIGLTPNRSDATSHLGVARDLSAYLRFNRDADKYVVREPEVEAAAAEGSGRSVSVEVKVSEACPRYSGVVLEGLQVGPSPEWLRKRLEAIGVRSVNNLVDVTNFVLHEMGQPLHAFDLDAIKGEKIVVRFLDEGSKFTTLDEVERTLSGEDLMICDGQGAGMCIAGVFGGVGSGVTEKTTAIFLESAHFDAKTVRRTSMRHLLRTDAAKIFEKGSDPRITVKALNRAVQLITEICGGHVTWPVVDIYPKEIAPVRVRLNHDRANALMGLDLTRDEVERLLDVLDMPILEKGDGYWVVEVPGDKSDVLREVDVIEELLRIYGFDQVALKDTVKSTIAVQGDESLLLFREKISSILEGMGFSEMMGLVLTPSRFLVEHMGYGEEEIVYVNNTSNIHLDAMRPNLLVTAIEAVRHNLNRQQPDLKLFEVGKEYLRGEDGYREVWKASLNVTGDRVRESWLDTGRGAADFHTVKGYVDVVCEKLGLSDWKVEELDGDKHFHYGLRYYYGRTEIVRFGAVRSDLLKSGDVKQALWHGVFDLEAMAVIASRKKLVFEPIPRYPESRRDLALVVGDGVQFSEMEMLSRKLGGELLREVNLFDVYRHDEHIGVGKKSYALSFLFRDDSKTIEEGQIEGIMRNMVKAFEEKLGAVVRQ